MCTYHFVDERLMSLRFELAKQCEVVHVIVAYAPIGCPKDADLKDTRYFLAEAGGLGGKDRDERASVCTDRWQRANWTDGGRVGDDESRVLGAYGRDVRNDNNGKQLLSFATNCKVTLTNTFFSTHKDWISHTPNGTSRMTVSGASTS